MPTSGTCGVSSTYSLGTGSLYLGGQVTYGPPSGTNYSGNGTLYVTSGGSLSAANLYVGGWSYTFAQYNSNPTTGTSNYSGTVSQDNGYVNITNEYIGYNGSETSYYKQTGGSNTVTTLYLGGTSAGAIGYYNLNGGTLNAGAITVQTGGGGINFGGGTLMVPGTFSSSVSGTLTSSTTSTINPNGYAMTLSGALSGGGALTETGGGTLTLSGSNSYSGGTTLSSSGVLTIGNSAALGTGAFIINGGTVSTTSSSFTLSNSENWNGDFTFKPSRALNLGTGAVTLGGNRIVTLGSGTSFPVTVGGIISGGYNLSVTGNGQLTFTGANNYTGSTSIDTSSIVQLGDGTTNGTLGSGAVTDNGGLIFKPNTSTAMTIVNTITGSGAVTVSTGTVTLSSTGNSVTGTTSIYATSTPTVLSVGAALGSGPLNIGTSGAAGSNYQGILKTTSSFTLNNSTIYLGSPYGTSNGTVPGYIDVASGTTLTILAP